MKVRAPFVPREQNGGREWTTHPALGIAAKVLFRPKTLSHNGNLPNDAGRSGLTLCTFRCVEFVLYVSHSPDGIIRMTIAAAGSGFLLFKWVINYSTGQGRLDINMKTGIIYPQNELQGDPGAVRKIGLATEELGFDHLLTYDHVLGATHDREPKLSGPYTEKDPFHDPFVMFSFLAGITQRIDLITGILILPQRQTALVARQAADLELLSNGRLKLGVGIGWNYVEYDALGQDFHTRGKRLEEQIHLLRQLWGSEQVVKFEGEFDHIDRAALNPRPKNNIPVWFGAFVEAALKRAVRLGDGLICVDSVRGDAFRQADRLKAVLRDAGRSADDFGLHCNMLNAKTPEDAVETASRWRDIGGTQVSVSTMGQGFTTADQHVEYMNMVAEALSRSDL